MDISGFVNESRNKCNFSGYPIAVHEGMLLLRQNKDPTRALRIHVGRGFRPPVPNRPVQVDAHLTGEEGVPVLRYIGHMRATIQSMPQRPFWLNSLRGLDKSKDPLDSLEQMRQDIKASMGISDETLESIIHQVESNSRFKRSFQNKIVLAGFVGAKAFKVPDNPNEEPYLHLLLKQHPDLSRAIPIDIFGVDSRYGSRLRTHWAVSVFASARMEPTADGGVALRIRSDWRGVAQADPSTFEHRRWPAWAIQELKVHHEQLVADGKLANEEAGRGSAPSQAKRAARDEAEEQPRRVTADQEAEGDGGIPTEMAAALAAANTSVATDEPATTGPQADEPGHLDEPASD